jgi:hypothetical protein
MGNERKYAIGKIGNSEHSIFKSEPEKLKGAKK